MSGTSSICKGGVVRDREAWQRWNEEVIAEFRASGGKVGGQFEGAPMLLLHSLGARTGLERLNPMMYLPDGDRMIVIASKAGSPGNPDWYHNLRPIRTSRSRWVTRRWR